MTWQGMRLAKRAYTKILLLVSLVIPRLNSLLAANMNLLLQFCRVLMVYYKQHHIIGSTIILKKMFSSSSTKNKYQGIMEKLRKIERNK